MPEREEGRRLYAGAVWSALCILMTVPVILAAFSPYLAYRNPAYLVGGFAGILCLALLLLQPLLAARYLPGLSGPSAAGVHGAIGAAIIVGVLIHVGGLYLTSPPDTIDALLLRAPTAFSLYGVAAMWAALLTAVLVGLRRRFRYPLWRALHNGLALFLVVTTIVHALLIEGAMEPYSKWILCLATFAATCAVLADLRILRPMRRRARRRAAPD